jgi:uncharacterized protein
VRHRDPTGHGGPLLWLGIYAVGVYGGYFGAAQGVLAVAMMGMAFADPVHRLNAIRNVLSLLAYAAAAGVFLATADVSWFAVALLAGGAIVGGALGARAALALRPGALRGLLLGVAAVTALVLTVRPEGITG